MILKNFSEAHGISAVCSPVKRNTKKAAGIKEKIS
jgi:hypothetical protein